MGKAPEKTCPECKTALHVRKRSCTCGYEFPKKEKKAKRGEDTNQEQIEVQLLFEGWKVVPPRARMISCGMCRIKMKGGTKGWHESFDDGDKYWWCERCITDDNYIARTATVC